MSFDITNCGNIYYNLRQLIYCKTETFITKRGEYYKQNNFITKYDQDFNKGIYYTTWYSSIFDNVDKLF